MRYTRTRATILLALTFLFSYFIPRGLAAQGVADSILVAACLSSPPSEARTRVEAIVSQLAFSSDVDVSNYMVLVAADPSDSLNHAELKPFQALRMNDSIPSTFYCIRVSPRFIQRHTKNEAMLAAALAHEMGHALLHHGEEPEPGVIRAMEVEAEADSVGLEIMQAAGYAEGELTKLLRDLEGQFLRGYESARASANQESMHRAAWTAIGLRYRLQILEAKAKMRPKKKKTEEEPGKQFISMTPEQFLRLKMSVLPDLRNK